MDLIDDPFFYVSVKNNAEYLIDLDREHTIETVRSSTEFKSINTPYVDFGLTPARVWLRVRISNPGNNGGQWRLDLRRQYNVETEVFLLTGDEPARRILHNTENSTFFERPVHSLLLAVDFELKAKQIADLYIAYRSSSTTYLPVGIGRAAGVEKVHAQEHTVNMVMNSVLLAMMVFTLLLTPVIGWRLSFAFSAYILVGLSYVGNADGYTFKYLWPNNPLFNDSANLSLMLLMSVFGLLFSRELFRFKEFAPGFDRLVLSIICVAGVFAVLAIPFIKTNWLMVLGYSLVPIGSVTQAAAGLVAIRKGLLGAIPYFVGALIVLSSIAYATVAHLMPGYFNLDTTLDYGHFALICECIAFATAISIRLIGLRNQRDAAIKAELKLTKDSLRLAKKLHQSQEEYIEARKISDLRKLKIENVSHDLRQPLASLRRAVDNTEIGNKNSRSRLTDAIDYLEDLAKSSLQSDVAMRRDFEDEREQFAVSNVLDNAVTMFTDEAIEKNIRLRYRRSDLTVSCAPIKLMRIVTNVVANAIRHNADCDVLICARRKKTKVSVEIWDSGQGIDPEMLEAALNRHTKDLDSLGSGLGLNIVKGLCHQEGMHFSIKSKVGKGTVAKILVNT